jgi:prepilin-type N-terminal cleavage/methylation domain-containing protein
MGISIASDRKPMRLTLSKTLEPRRQYSAFTLAEVVIAIAIVAIVYGGMFMAYTQSTKRAQWTGYSLAAQALAIQQIEQARAAVWDPSKPENDFTNLNLISPHLTGGSTNYIYTGYTWTNLDLPTAGGNFVTATNYVTIRMLNYTNITAVQLQMVRVDTVWPFTWGSGAAMTTRLYTNTTCTYEAPDNRDNSTL